jgi:hypothetical protein
MKVTVFVVTSEHDHECSHTIGVFLLRSASELFRAACANHDRLKPECPPAEDGPENDKLWARYDRELKRWLKYHPAGFDTSHCDQYCVQEVELC